MNGKLLQRYGFVILLLVIVLITAMYLYGMCVSPSNLCVNINNKSWKHVDVTSQINEDSVNINNKSWKYVDVTSQINEDELIELARTIHKARLYSRGIRTSDLLSKSLDLVNRILIKTKHNITDIYNRETVESANICPEVLTFPDGFTLQNCSHSKPLFQLITIILDPLLYQDRLLEKPQLDKINKMLSTSGGNVSVIVPSSNKGVVGKYENIKFVNLNKMSIGDKWNTLIKTARTKYVLLARRVDLLTKDMRLESLIREIESQRVLIAGGATRDENGHWRIGCKQSAFRNYTITYEDGYFESLHGCVYCDHIDGPFVAVKSIFDDVTLNRALPETGLFEEFFLRVKAKYYESIICPDSMFFIQSNTNNSTLSKQWKAFAKHLDLYKLIINNREIIFPCNISGRCSQKGFVNSPCCLREQSNGIKLVMKLCEEGGAICEFHGGTTLGAVKLSRTLPWDIDADISYLPSNHSALIKLKPQIIKGGYKCSIRGKRMRCGKENRTQGVVMYVCPRGGWRIELWGICELDAEMAITSGMKPTKVYFDGMWVICPTNPGLHVKMLYGPEVYRHAQHWRHLGMRTSADYRPGNCFTKCPKPHKHSCLDQYKTDGNIQFSDPVL